MDVDVAPRARDGRMVRRRGRRNTPVTERIVSGISPLSAVAAVLVLLQLAVRGWVVTGSYYFQDDFAHLDMARRLGLSSEYLVRDYGGHLEVGQYGLIWVISHFVDGSFAPAAASILVLQAVASVLLFVLLRTLFGASPLILVPWCVYLFTPLAVGWSSWWSAALQALPLQIATMLVLLATTHAFRKRSRAWGLASVVFFAAGLAMWEKAVLILPLALAVHLLVAASPAPWKDRLWGLRRNIVMWLAHAALLAAYMGLYLSVVDGDGFEDPSAKPLSLSEVLDRSLLRTFVPGVLGGPWHAEGAESTMYPFAGDFQAGVFGVAFLVLVLLSFLVTGRRAAEGWTLLAGYLAADLALLMWGRTDWAGFLARDPRYVADALPVLAVALLAAFRGVLEPQDQRRAVADWLRPRLSAQVTFWMVAVLLVSCLVTTARLAPAVQHHESANYTLAVSRQLEENPQRSVINERPPFAISARADLAGMMNAVGSPAEFDRPATQMYVFDGFGQMRPLDLFPGTEVHRGPLEKGCGWDVRSGEQHLFEIEDDAAAPRVLRLGYYSGGEATLRVSVEGRSQTLDLPGGLGRAFFAIGSQSGSLTASLASPGAVCVTDAAVGYAWAASDGSAQ